MEELESVIRELRENNEWVKGRDLTNFIDKFLEEMREVIEAISISDYDNLCEEIGDVLFHLVLFSIIAEEKGLFTLQDCIDSIVDKMKERHLKEDL